MQITNNISHCCGTHDVVRHIKCSLWISETTSQKNWAHPPPPPPALSTSPRHFLDCKCSTFVFNNNGQSQTVRPGPQNHMVLPHLPQSSSTGLISTDSASIVGCWKCSFSSLRRHGWSQDDLLYWESAFDERILTDKKMQLSRQHKASLSFSCGAQQTLVFMIFFSRGTGVYVSLWVVIVR